jgi:hypothetical protein
MAQRPNLPQGITTISPPGVSLVCKTVQVLRSDTTAFDAFYIPKGAVLAGVYVLGTANSNAGTTAVINVGSNPGTTNEVLANYNVLTGGVGYNPAAAAAGTSIGTQFTVDTKIQAKYAETGGASSAGGPWLVKIEYYMTSAGFPAY